MTHTNTLSRQYIPYLVLFLAGLSFLMTAIISDRVFERLPHLEDELAYLFQARIFANGDIVAPIPENYHAYWQPFVITNHEDGVRFGKYHPGWPALLAVGILLGQMWTINAFASALTVCITYRLGREIFSEDVGLIGALLLTFSPMALLLNSTLMSHTSALLFTTCFIYGYWRSTQPRHKVRWALFAGVALGLVFTIRPTTAVAVSAPFVLHTLLILILRLETPRTWFQHAKPPIMLAIATLLFVPTMPLFNYATSGDPMQNLYLIVWKYDTLGFGENYGVAGHSIAKGVRNTHSDLSMMAVDLFGWTARPVTENGRLLPVVHEYLLYSQTKMPVAQGLGFIVIIAGALIGWRRHPLYLICAILAIGWIVYPVSTKASFLAIRSVTDAYTQIWLWLMGGLAIFSLPLLGLRVEMDQRQQRALWIWLLMMVGISIIGIHLAYWVGAQRYSTRYYFEALSALCLLGALGFGWLATWIPRKVVYAFVVTAVIAGFVTYSIPRVAVLYQFNRVSQSAIDQILTQRQDDRPILIISKGENMVWRAIGTFMALTDPYLKNDLIVALDRWDDREALIAQHPERQVIDIEFDGENSWLAGCTPRDAPTCRVNPPKYYP